MQAAARLCDVLREGGVRCAVDTDPHQSPGWCVLLGAAQLVLLAGSHHQLNLCRKFNHWEMKGVPLRIDIGPRDLESGSAPMSRRDGGPRATVPLLPEPEAVAEGAQGDGDREEVVARAARLLVSTVLEDVGATLLRQAEERLATAIVDVDDYAALLACWGKEDGPEPGRGEGFRWARVWWDGDEEDEAAVQSASGATLRCFPLPSDAHGNGDDERCGSSGRSDGLGCV